MIYILRTFGGVLAVGPVISYSTVTLSRTASTLTPSRAAGIIALSRAAATITLERI